jgi:hypothetical protein
MALEIMAGADITMMAAVGAEVAMEVVAEQGANVAQWVL